MNSRRIMLCLSFCLAALLSGCLMQGSPTAAVTAAAPEIESTTAQPESAGQPAAPDDGEEESGTPESAEAAAETTPPQPNEDADPGASARQLEQDQAAEASKETEAAPAGESASATTPAGDEAAAADLEQYAYELWQIGVDCAAEGPCIEGVAAFPLSQDREEELWAAHTVGLRSFVPTEEQHRIGIFRTAGDSWEEVVSMDVAGQEADMLIAPDYLGAGSVRQVTVDEVSIWLQVGGGIGAHGGTFNLLRFDGETLESVAASTSASPGAGDVRDLNGDGMGDVIFNSTEPYVFCYACGVAFIDYTVRRWDGESMQPVTLEELPTSDPLAELNNTAVALAEAGLYKDALALLAEAEGEIQGTDNPIFTWNVALIRLVGEARQARLENEGAYPILERLFFGDYTAAIEPFRALEPAEIYTVTSPLIVGTIAEGWEEQLTWWITFTTTPALELQPDLAPAYFLRSWALYLEGQTEAAAADAAQAAALAPDDELFAAAAEYLADTAPAPAATVQALTNINVRRGPGTDYEIIGRLLAGSSAEIVGRSEANGSPWWQIVFPGGEGGRAWITGDSRYVEAAGADAVPVIEAPAR